MARLSRASKPARPLRDISDDDDADDDDEFPNLATLARRKIEQLQSGKAGNEKEKVSDHHPEKAQKTPKPPTVPSMRRRKLVPVTNNALLRAWAPDSIDDSDEYLGNSQQETGKSSQPPRVELRTRKPKNAASAPTPSNRRNIKGEDVSEQKEVTIIEEISIISIDDDDDEEDDVFQSAESNASNFEDNDEDGDDDSLSDFFAKILQPKKPQSLAAPTTNSRSTNHNREEVEVAPQRGRKQSVQTQKAAVHMGKDLTDTFSRLHIRDVPSFRLDDDEKLRPRERRTTTPPPLSPPSNVKPGLVSPRKLPRIPQTPHRPSSDIFWSHEFVSEWNDEHSPRKQLFPDAVKATKTPSKPTTSPMKKKDTFKPISAREAKKTFEKVKHEMAERFLDELDTAITNGQLSELAASAGGIKLNWNNKLNTTAGRANWKRETVRTTTTKDLSATAGDNTSSISIKHHHHASIELAEKVIDDEHRLLNVIAHEFCHLANFMVSGITTNPHGKEFKAWAAKCSSAFGDRGIEVTTKHSYDIDFKYVWECSSCAMQYKRHSKSINPERHRCGGCKSELKQTKPTPRVTAPGKQPSEYQRFMKEQMKVLREENPGSPQKDIMKLVASRWTAQGRGSQTPTLTGDGVENTVKGFGSLKIKK